MKVYLRSPCKSPSVPCWIMRVPEMWAMWILSKPSIFRNSKQRAGAFYMGLVECPFQNDSDSLWTWDHHGQGGLVFLIALNVDTMCIAFQQPSSLHETALMSSTYNAIRSARCPGSHLHFISCGSFLCYKPYLPGGWGWPFHTGKGYNNPFCSPWYIPT